MTTKGRQEIHKGANSLTQFQTHVRLTLTLKSLIFISPLKVKNMRVGSMLEEKLSVIINVKKSLCNDY